MPSATSSAGTPAESKHQTPPQHQHTAEQNSNDSTHDRKHVFSHNNGVSTPEIELDSNGIDEELAEEALKVNDNAKAASTGRRKNTLQTMRYTTFFTTLDFIYS